MEARNGGGRDLTAVEYRARAEFRYQIRHFLRFSEQAAREAGLNPQHHQLLLAVKGRPEGSRPTIGEIAARLHLLHNSVVELVDRAAARGLVMRRPAAEDNREVLIRLSPKGERVLRRLTLAHWREIQSAAPALAKSLQRLTRLSRYEELHEDHSDVLGPHSHRLPRIRTRAS